jgi:tetratricopeptide (TPR) repeat protein
MNKAVRMFLVFCLLALGGFSVSLASIKDPIYDEFESIPLVDALLRDGRIKDSENELRALSPSSLGYWRAQGNLAMARNDGARAIDFYLKEAQSPELKRLLARAYSLNGDLKLCVEAYRASDESWRAHRDDVFLKSDCEFKTSEMNDSWRTLQILGAEYAVEIRRIELLLELGLAREALERAVSVCRTPSEFQTQAEKMREKGRAAEAMELLEVARLRFPRNLDLNLTLAPLFFRANLPLATVDSFERAAVHDRKFAFHASELHRQLLNFERAEYFATMINSDQERVKSRVARYIDRQQFPLITSLEVVKEDSEIMIASEEITYAVAYSHGRLGNTEGSLNSLARLMVTEGKPEFVRKAELLKKAVSACSNGSGSCRL